MSSQGDAPVRRPSLVHRLGMGQLQVAARISDINNGIISTAGIVEGFSGAGVGGTAVLLAAVSAMIAGGIAVGGAKYAEVASQLEVQQAVLAEIQRVLELSPQEELAELTDIYRAKGLSPPLAKAVAEELSETDALAAHAEAEYGIEPVSTGPRAAAAGAGLAFMVGAALPLAIVWVTPLSLDGLITYVAVLASLAVSGTVLARLGHADLWHSLRRSLAVGVLTMSAAWLAGHAFV